jgi:hypothetical protein
MAEMDPKSYSYIQRREDIRDRYDTLQPDWIQEAAVRYDVSVSVIESDLKALREDWTDS